jgi:hypothetical protein
MCSENRLKNTPSQLTERSTSQDNQTSNRQETTLSSRKKGRLDPKLFEIVDFDPILEMYITLFSKHLYHDPKQTRDIHIVIENKDIQQSYTQFISNQKKKVSVQTPSLHSGDKAMSPKTYQTSQSNASSNITAAGYQEMQKSKYLPLFKFRNIKPFGF